VRFLGSKVLRYTIIAIVALVGAVALARAFPVKLPDIVMAPEPIAQVSHLGLNYSVTNSLLTSWLAMLLLVLLAIATTHRMKAVPEGLQNLMEALVEAIYGLVEDVSKHNARKFFPIVATIFLFVLVSNWLGLLPFFGPLGVWHEVKGHSGEVERVLIPLFRSPSTDLNTTVGLALISVTMTQVFGVQALGVFGYFGRFLNLRGLGKLIGALFGRPQRLGPGGLFGLAFNAFLDLFVGLLELISELAKIISFSFRLFGNIFAGEVLLAVIAFLFPFLLSLPFLGLEVFVGFIQAFIFAILTLAFMAIATVGHGTEEHRG